MLLLAYFSAFLILQQAFVVVHSQHDEAGEAETESPPAEEPKPPAEEPPPPSPPPCPLWLTLPVSGGQIVDTCMRCICQMRTGCDVHFGCVGGGCGPFNLTFDQWTLGGRHTLRGDSPCDGDVFAAYQNCTKDFFCSTQTVQTVVKSPSPDCGADGSLECKDFAAQLIFGDGGCLMYTETSLQPIITCLDWFENNPI